MKYRISQWIDTSPESMNKPTADIWYGIQAEVPVHGWLHVSEGGKTLNYRTQEEAVAKLEAIEAAEKEGREP